MMKDSAFQDKAAVSCETAIRLIAFQFVNDRQKFILFQGGADGAH
ncbi:MAG: hypothetical protein ACJAU6_000041 [Alphaproteobacteria bacterium]|jgi:hypothetical protein